MLGERSDRGEYGTVLEPRGLLLGGELPCQAVGHLYLKSESSGFVPSCVRQLNSNELTSNRISTNVMPERAGFICVSGTSLEERLISVP